MREIKFRAWHKMYKKMLYFELGELNDSMITKIDDGWYLEDCAIMQYTGLHDKNGLQIYEGDIVSWEGGMAPGYTKPKPEIVQWHEGLCGFEPFCFYDSHCDGVPHADDYGGYEVIGNIWEQKHLIEQE